MSRQDKAITERNAKALRELLKKPENKVCADCKRNDPRWASWNLGVFLCIRCSGIHRSMGTHISKVKSIDLDTWTPPQLEAFEKWGNRLANKYWEAHLKVGHIPADHKMDSFIRSKYETRRWALEGPVPEDPTALDTDSPAAVPDAAPVAAPPVRTQAPVQAPVAAPRHQLISSRQQQPQPQRLQPPSGVAPVAPVAPAQPAPPPQNDLFSLDFHSPTPPVSSSPPPNSASRNPKQDIMSLFASSSPPPQPQGGAVWSQPQQQQQQQQQRQQPVPQQQSMMGNNGAGMWGVSSGWSGPAQQQAQPNVWGDFAGGASGGTAGMGQPVQQQPGMQYGGQPQMQFGGQAPVPAFGGAQPQQQLFGTNDIWGSTAPAAAAGGNAGGQKDAFEDIWGGFK